MTRVRLLAAYLLLLTAACSADPPVKPSQAARTPQASIAQETGPGRYTHVLDPCALLTAERSEQLVPFALGAYSGPACVWRPSAPSLPAASAYELVVSFHLATDITRARAYLQDPPADLWWAAGRTKTRDPATNSFPGVGDESVVYDLGPSSTVLGYRLSNVVIIVRYGRFREGKPAQDDPRQRDDARKAALWVAEAVARSAPTVADPSDGRFAAAPYACSLVKDGKPLSATSCDHGDVTVRHAAAWGGKSGIAVAKAMFAHYRSKPFKMVNGLGDEAFQKKDTIWVRVSNLVVTVRGSKADAATVIDRLPS
ncbi:hypothetical protein OHA25_37270 [Nonomuraea sp. NBC_00507]|uniref:hypothetical protein n=1 Tax=Nonomuraea sp. NBC_00507 TaxID=2976002 RepID=UPI002E199881